MRRRKFESAVCQRHGVLAEKLVMSGLCLKERRELNKLRWYFDKLYPELPILVAASCEERELLYEQLAK